MFYWSHDPVIITQSYLDLNKKRETIKEGQGYKVVSFFIIILFYFQVFISIGLEFHHYKEAFNKADLIPVQKKWFVCKILNAFFLGPYLLLTIYFFLSKRAGTS